MIFFRTLLFTILVPGTVLVWIPLSLLSPRSSPAPASNPLRWLGLLPIVIGTIVYGWCAWDFGAAGRGTPNPLDPPKAIVTTGLYKHVRNPIYLGGLLILLGEAIVLHSSAVLWYALVVWLVWHCVVVLYEEPHLKKVFGTQYEQYVQTVPRWIPRFSPRKSP